MEKFSKKNKIYQILGITLSVVVSVFLVVLVVYSATTIGTSVDTGGYASSTSALNTQGSLHVGGNATTSGLTIGTSTSHISNLLFGSCSISFASAIGADVTTSSDCTATGVGSDHWIFITPEWLEAGLVFHSASSTVNNIRVFIHNASSSAITGSEQTWQWMAIR